MGPHGFEFNDLLRRLATFSGGSVLPLVSQLDIIDSTHAYYGKAVEGSLASAPVWLIMKITLLPNEAIDVKYAGGNSTAYTSIWNNRASLSYS